MPEPADWVDRPPVTRGTWALLGFGSLFFGVLAIGGAATALSTSSWLGVMGVTAWWVFMVGVHSIVLGAYAHPEYRISDSALSVRLGLLSRTVRLDEIEGFRRYDWPELRGPLWNYGRGLFGGLVIECGFWNSFRITPSDSAAFLAELNRRLLARGHSPL